MEEINMKQETVTFDDRLSFTVIEFTEQKVIRIWYDKEDDTYCYQYFDFAVDDEPIELSGRYVNDRINIVSADDFISAYGYTQNNLSIDGRKPICVFYNDTNSEIPYIGVYNDDDTYALIGAKYDNIISLEDMFDKLING
jgi:hypothetical protein